MATATATLDAPPAKAPLPLPPVSTQTRRKRFRFRLAFGMYIAAGALDPSDPHLRRLREELGAKSDGMTEEQLQVLATAKGTPIRTLDVVHCADDVCARPLAERGLTHAGNIIETDIDLAARFNSNVSAKFIPLRPDDNGPFGQAVDPLQRRDDESNAAYVKRLKELQRAAAEVLASADKAAAALGKNLDAMTRDQLIEHAADNEITLPQMAKGKDEILRAIRAATAST